MNDQERALWDEAVLEATRQHAAASSPIELARLVAAEADRIVDRSRLLIMESPNNPLRLGGHAAYGGEEWRVVDIIGDHVELAHAEDFPSALFTKPSRTTWVTWGQVYAELARDP